MSVTNENIFHNPNNFDPLKHRPPKYDIFGRLVNNKNIIIEKNTCDPRVRTK